MSEVLSNFAFLGLGLEPYFQLCIFSPQQPYLETDLNAMDEDTSKDLEVDEDTSKDLQLALDLEKKPPSPVKRDKRKASQIFKPVKAKKQMQ